MYKAKSSSQVLYNTKSAIDTTPAARNGLSKVIESCDQERFDKDNRHTCYVKTPQSAFWTLVLSLRTRPGSEPACQHSRLTRPARGLGYHAVVTVRGALRAKFPIQRRHCPCPDFGSIRPPWVFCGHWGLDPALSLSDLGSVCVEEVTFYLVNSSL